MTATPFPLNSFKVVGAVIHNFIVKLCYLFLERNLLEQAFVLMPIIIVYMVGAAAFVLCAHLAIGRNGLVIRGLDVGVIVERSLGPFIGLSGLAIMGYAVLSKSFLGSGIFGHLLLSNWKLGLAGFAFGYSCVFASYLLEQP